MTLTVLADSELKREVLQVTGGRQTPWIARNQMVGEVPLF